MPDKMTFQKIQTASRDDLVAWLLSINNDASLLNNAGHKPQPPGWILLELLASSEQWSLTIEQLRAFAEFALYWMEGGHD